MADLPPVLILETGLEVLRVDYSRRPPQLGNDAFKLRLPRGCMVLRRALKWC